MAPNSDVILTSQARLDAVQRGCSLVDWTLIGWNLNAAINQDCQMPLQLWLDNTIASATKASADYETFNPRLYALDLFVPLDALGQENTWASSRDRGWWGW